MTNDEGEKCSVYWKNLLVLNYNKCGDFMHIKVSRGICAHKAEIQYMMSMIFGPSGDSEDTIP